ncbi:MAG: LacI family DNA-binding transcriptional regulator, partial [Puniceicoccales bacterium]
MKKVRPVTQSQIAKEVGISQAAVSAILSGSGLLNISAETSERVLAVARDLGYQNRGSSRSKGASVRGKRVLLVGSSRSVSEEGMLIGDSYSAAVGNMVSVYEHALSEQGLELTVARFDDAKSLMGKVGARDVAGVLWHASESESALLHWIAARVPLVLLNRECR